MATQHPNLVDFKYVTAGMYTLAGSVTIARLVVRARQKKWWWDDTLALVSLIVMAVVVAGACVVLQPAKKLQIYGYYLVVSGYYITIWAARLSILFTIIRIAPWPRQRKILMGCACFFVIQWLLLMVQVFWVCEITSPRWKSEEGLCVLNDAVVICQVMTTLISDLTLIFSPIWIIHRVRLNPGLRFRLLSAFFVSIITTVAALVHSVLVIKSPGAWEVIFGAVEAGVAMTVCNASVIIPAIARKVSSSETYHDNDPTLTTIGGSGRKRHVDAARLSTLHITDLTNTAVRVDVTVDQDNSDSKSTQKGFNSGDGESIEEFPSTKTRGVDFSPI